MLDEEVGFVGQTCSEASIVTSGVPLSPSADEASISPDSKEAGLWLWKGEAPPSPSLPRPKSTDQQILRRIMHTAGWAGCIALPAGLALTFVAISVMPHPDKPPSADPPAVALSPVPPPTLAHPSGAVPQAELMGAPTDQVLVPSAPAVKVEPRGPEPRMAEWHVQRKSPRMTRKTHASHMRSGPPIIKPGVLTPPMTWNEVGW
jgi:hypothetical protein